MDRAGPSHRKRSRRATPEAPAPPSTAELTEQHQIRLANIRQYTWYPMLRLDLAILITFSWDQEVQRYLQGIGWDFLLRDPPSRIYRTSTMEFLATATLIDMPSFIPGVPSIKGVSYWMNGAYRTTLLDDFNVIMGFHQRQEIHTAEYQSALCDRPASYTVQVMWEAITGSSVVPTHLKGASLMPPLRICHKLLAGTLHGRKESQGKVTQSDLFILYCMHMGYRCNPGYLFLKALKDFGTRGPAGTIMMGPLITPLAEYWGCTDGEDIPESLRTEPIDGSVLSHMGILTRQGSGYVISPYFSMHIDIRDLDTSGSQEIPIPPEFQQQQQQQQYESDLAGLHQHLYDDRAYHEGQYQLLRQQLDRMALRQDAQGRAIEDMARSQEAFQRRMLRRFPSPAPSAASSTDHEEEQP